MHFGAFSFDAFSLGAFLWWPFRWVPFRWVRFVGLPMFVYIILTRIKHIDHFGIVSPIAAAKVHQSNPHINSSQARLNSAAILTPKTCVVLVLAEWSSTYMYVPYVRAGITRTRTLSARRCTSRRVCALMAWCAPTPPGCRPSGSCPGVNADPYLRAHTRR